MEWHLPLSCDSPEVRSPCYHCCTQHTACCSRDATAQMPAMCLTHLYMRQRKKYSAWEETDFLDLLLVMCAFVVKVRKVENMQSLCVSVYFTTWKIKYKLLGYKEAQVLKKQLSRTWNWSNYNNVLTYVYVIVCIYHKPICVLMWIYMCFSVLITEPN